jgi:hypothetical protein
MKTLLVAGLASLAVLAAGSAAASERHDGWRSHRHDDVRVVRITHRSEPQVQIYIGPRIRYEPFGVYRVVPRVEYRYYEDRHERRFERRHERRHDWRDDWREERRHDNRRDWDDHHPGERSRRNHYK